LIMYFSGSILFLAHMLAYRVMVEIARSF